MKTRNLCLLLGILLAFLSCSKDKDIPQHRLSARDIQVTKQLRDFQQSLLLKSTNPMTTDDADWHIEGLLNLEKAYNYHNFINLQFKTDSILLASSNGMISGEQIEQAFDYFAGLLDSYSANQGSAFGFDVVDIHSVETELKDGSVVMYMESVSGEELVYNYVLFGQDEFWYWGWNMGGCNSYQGSGDAAQKLQYKFNHPMAVLEPGYFTDVEAHEAWGPEYNDVTNPGPYCDYMIFHWEPLNQTLPEPCLGPEELNFYLSKFDYIKEDKRPANLTFRDVEVIADIFPNGTLNRFHYYILRYGIFTVAALEE